MYLGLEEIKALVPEEIRATRHLFEMSHQCISKRQTFKFYGITCRSAPPSTMGKAQQLLAGLQATGDESRQLQAAIEMCQVMTCATYYR